MSTARTALRPRSELPACSRRTLLDRLDRPRLSAEVIWDRPARLCDSPSQLRVGVAGRRRLWLDLNAPKPTVGECLLFAHCGRSRPRPWTPQLGDSGPLATTMPERSRSVAWAMRPRPTNGASVMSGCRRMSWTGCRHARAGRELERRDPAKSGSEVGRRHSGPLRCSAWSPNSLDSCWKAGFASYLLCLCLA